MRIFIGELSRYAGSLKASREDPKEDLRAHVTHKKTRVKKQSSVLCFFLLYCWGYVLSTPLKPGLTMLLFMSMCPKRRFPNRFLLSLLSVLVLPGQAAFAQLPASNLTVEVSGIRNAEGQVCISLFAGSAGFPESEEAIAQEACVAALTTEPLEAPDADKLPEVPHSGDSPLENSSLTEMSAEASTEVPLPAVPETIFESMDQAVAEMADSTTAIVDASASEISDDVALVEAVLAVTFPDIAPGTYAVSVVHDENADGELNTGNFGIPLEGFGFSQNPEIRTRAPEFSEAAIVVVGSETTTQIELIYY